MTQANDLRDQIAYLQADAMLHARAAIPEKEPTSEATP